MKLQYIFGTAGSGKLNHCIDQILIRQEQQKQNSIFIIPEQFTLQAEKKVIEKSSSKVLLNTKVLNFKRLAYRIFSEIGLSNKTPLEEIGQTMILRKILSELGKKDKLKYFSEKCYANMGLLDKISETLKEFFEANLSITDFEEVINNIQDNNLKIKLKDLKLIYEEYKDFLKKDYVTDETLLDILADSMQVSNLIDEKTQVFIYGFEGFNNQELNILYRIFEKCEKVHIYFTLDDNKTYYQDLNIFDYYYYTKSTINKINDKIISKLGVEVQSPIYLKEDKRHKDNEELKFLQQNFLRYKPNKYEKEVKNIDIYACKNKYFEVEKVSSIVLNLVKNQGYRYKDIAIILGDLSYQKSLKTAFNKYKLPYFLDDKKKITNHCLIELIICALDIVIYNFKYESIFRYLRTGFFDVETGVKIPKEDIDILENYVLKYGIKGKKWLEDFKYGFYENSVYSFDNINDTRKKFLKSIQKLDFSKTKKYTVSQISEQIVNFLLTIDIRENLIHIIERDKEFLEKGYIKNAGIIDEHIQVFNVVFETLQKFVEILGEEKVTIEEYSKILKTAFEKQTISIIPPTQDQILIGDFDRTKITDNKVLICMGMNEGNVPNYKQETPFISDNEKINLMANGLDIKPTSLTAMSTQMLSIYSLMLKPQDKLYLSYCLSTLDGKDKKISPIVQKVDSIFDKLNIKYDEDSLYFCPEMAFDNIFKGFDKKTDIDDKTKDIFTWFLNNEEYLEKLNTMETGLNKIKSSQDDYIKQEYIEKLYEDKNIFTSVSKLEEFKKCPFSYFLKYILNIKDRDNSILDYLKLGNLYHTILEEFSNRVLKHTKILENITEKDIYQTLEQIIQEISKKEEISNLFDIAPKYKYYLNRIKNIVFISAKALINQINDGNFEPKHFELDFNNINSNAKIKNKLEINLKDDYKVKLKGKIDRVDKFFIDEKEYIKILDYKSSDKALSLDKVYYGLQLQLLMYLDIFVNMEQELNTKEVLPAGAFYFHIKEETLKEDSKKDNLQDEFNLKGIVLEDENVKKGFDKSGEKSKKGIKGVKSSETLSKEQFSKLLSLANVVTKEISQEIITGDIKVYPYKYKTETGCSYCQYKDICNFDILEKDNKYNCFNAINENNIFEKIDEKLKQQEESE